MLWPVVSGVVPEGGCQDPQAFLNLTQDLNPTRELARIMYPGEFLGLCWKHKHPRYFSVGVVYSELTNQYRHEAGYDEHGTLFFATPHDRDVPFTIPSNCFPYTPIRTREWDDYESKWKLGGELRRGWRGTLTDLVKNGYLKHHPDLSFLIGMDTFKIAKKEFK